MSTILSEGKLNSYRYYARMKEAQGSISISHTEFAAQKTTVFISHKHNDLDNLKDVIGFLESEFNVEVYIDSQDPALPRITSGETASRIKDRIKGCKKFMLLATNDAIESKWCNWELGYGDAQKFREHIALFPLKSSGQSDSAYKGSEYMSIYPYVAFYDGSEKYTNGTPITKGYYICTKSDTGLTIVPLSSWLTK